MVRNQISYMRVAAAFAVVLIHVSANAVVERDPYSQHIGHAFNSLGRWAVPLFVMISGAMLLSSSKRHSVREFYARRVMRIVPPLLFWNLVYFRLMYWGAHLSVAQAADIVVYKGGFYWHLWYLPMILGLYLMTPFLQSGIRRISPRDRWLLVVPFCAAVSACYLVWGHLLERVPTIALSIPFLSYFVLGYCLDALHVGRKTVFACIVLFLLAYVGTVAGDRALGDLGRFQHPFSPTIFVMAASVFLVFRGWFGGKDTGRATWMHRLAAVTMGVYLVHPLVIHTMRRFSVSDSSTPWLAIPLWTVAVFVVSLAVSLAWARVVPCTRRAWVLLRAEKPASPEADGAVSAVCSGALGGSDRDK